MGNWGTSPSSPTPERQPAFYLGDLSAIMASYFYCRGISERIRDGYPGGADLPIHEQKRCMEAQTLTKWGFALPCYVVADGWVEPPQKANLDNYG
jgi:hypothetical protein